MSDCVSAPSDHPSRPLHIAETSNRADTQVRPYDTFPEKRALHEVPLRHLSGEITTPVIPAKAGIHFDFSPGRAATTLLSRGVRMRNSENSPFVFVFDSDPSRPGVKTSERGGEKTKAKMDSGFRRNDGGGQFRPRRDFSTALCHGAISTTSRGGTSSVPGPCCEFGDGNQRVHTPRPRFVLRVIPQTRSRPKNTGRAGDARPPYFIITSQYLVSMEYDRESCPHPHEARWRNLLEP